MRGNGFMDYSYDKPSRTLRWDFTETIKPVEFQHPDISSIDAVSQIACVWGYKRRVENGAALGQSATAAAKREKMAGIVEILESGHWELPRGAKPKTVNIDALVAAMVATSGKLAATVRAFLEKKAEDVRAALSQSARFAEAYAVALAQQRPVVKLDDEMQAEIDAI